jgi:hypothetical protein
VVTKNGSVVEFQDTGLPGYELQSSIWNWQLQNNGKKELGGAKTTSCVICSGSETIINPLPGYG